MDRLSPKPENGTKKHSWEHLDSLLQSNFKTDTYVENRKAVINLDEYDLVFSEIKYEAEKQGYTIKDLGNNMIEFT